jgi:eukaryotic-like serine/threonine-protein kinase
MIEKIGEGGMGVVYRAEDSNLSRPVAVKMLPLIFAGDPTRLARFEREAKVLASLSHPKIAAIYGLEQVDGKRFLVLELVEGKTLAQRIVRGPIPVEEALGICRQIAEGLEAAHEKGIIHRDLKPANIQITADGRVKILDFGPARIFRDPSSDLDEGNPANISESMTRPGLVLGTAAYMSPEQTKGEKVDKRSDIWSSGCILYECLTGKPAFQGATVAETVASILKSEPDWTLLPANIPAMMR